MALTEINSLGVKDLEVKTADIANDAVNGDKIADDAINSEHYTDGSIDTAHIGDDQVTAAKIVDNIALPGNITTTGTLAPTGVLTANAGVVVDNITIDGQEIDLSSGELTIDCADTINLDADGAIVIKQAGSEIGRFSNSSNNMRIQTAVSDADLLFRGNDGGSTITALTLDMSEAGAATFNDKIVATELDISGNIDVDGTANLDVVDIDGAVDMASTLGVSGVVTANAGVVVDNITIDGTEIDLSSGDMTIDIAGNLRIDCDDAGEVRFYDGGTQYGVIKKDSDRLKLQSIIEDKDILFAGNDGGSEITALSLDMSDAGTATFNHDVKLHDSGEAIFGAGSDLRIYHDGANSHIVNNYGALYIDQDKQDGNLVLRCDDMSGGLHDYFYLDGGSGSIKGKAIRDIEWTTTATNSTAGHHIFKSYNTEIMRIDGANNRVGIGTDSPDDLLHVYGGSAGSVSANSNADLIIEDNDHAFLQFLTPANKVAGFYFGDADDNDVGSMFYDHNTNHIEVNISGNQIMKILTDKVGIGTDSPGSRLEVRGASNGTSLAEFSGTDGRGLKIFTQKSDYPTDSGQNDAVVVYNAQDSESNAIYSGHVFQYGGNEVLRLQRIESSGNTGAVGINDNAPAYTLDVNTDGESNAMRITQGTNTKDCSVLFQNTATGTGDDTYLTMKTAHAAGDPFVRLQIAGYEHWDLRVDNSDNDSFKIMQQSDTRMMISGGRILFGTTSELSPTSRVFINSNSNSTNPALNLKAATTTSSGSVLIFFAGDSDEVGSVNMSNLEQGTGVNYSSGSDYRLKENVTYSWDATTRLKQLKPARFSWKKDSNSTMQDGFLAHEVSSIVPEAVTGDKDAMQPIRYKEGDNIPSGKQVGDETGSYSTTEIKSQMLDPAKLVPLLVKTIQELEARITVLEG